MYYGEALVSRIDKNIGLFCKKKAYKREDILQKRPIILSILLTVATPSMGIPYVLKVYTYEPKVYTYEPKVYTYEPKVHNLLQGGEDS